MRRERCFFVVCILIISALFVQAQSGSSVDISGVVVEEANDAPIEQATIRLLNVRDSTFIGGVASGKNGVFTLKSIRPGSYLLQISYIGFEHLYQPLQITGRTNPVNLGKLGLADGSVMLGEAIVTGKAPEIVVRNDTIEYNADSYKVTEGSVLEDLLKKMPGVEIDDDGKVTVNGKEVKKVLVDGKEFFSDDPKVASKNLPSNMVDKVQVLQRLSEMSRMTGFDDGEEETVINLTVKPGMKEGWFGNAFAGYGNKDRYEGNAMVNRFVNNDQITVMGGLNNTNNMGFSDLSSTMFEGMGGGGRGGFMGGGRNGITSSWNTGLNFSKEFNKMMELGGNGRFAHSDNETLSKTSTQNFQEDGLSLYDYDDTYRNSKSDNVGANFRMEWKPDSMTTIIFRPNLSLVRSEQLEQGQSYGLDNNNIDTTYVGTVDSYSKGDSYNLNGQLEFSRKLNNNGRIFSASFSGGINETTSDGYNKTMTDYVSRADIYRDQQIENENSGYNYRGYASWVEPIGNNNFLQLTYSINQRKQDQLKNAFNQNSATGQYTDIDTTQTQNFRNNYLNQRASLSFKSIRAKFNYTIGFNVDPTSSSSERFIGDSVLYKLSQNVVNFSPSAQFRFNFSRQSNLRIDYDGRTSQPNMTQMQPVPDYSNPTNVKVGNPDLKPSYSNNMSIRYQSFNPERQTALMVMADGNYVMDDVANFTINATDNSGFRATTYENVNGNFSANMRVMMNTPLKNRKFTVSSMTMAGYSNRVELVGYMDDTEGDIVDLVKSVTKTKSISKNLNLMERASIDFRSSIIDLGINGNIRYNDVNYSLRPDENQQTFTYGVGGRTTLYLPYNFKIESDVNWSANSGYAAGYEQNEVLWNASASKSFLKGNQMTLRLKMYDILQQRSNISQSITANKMAYTEYNTINSYFMMHLIYRFSIFKGGATMKDTFGGGRGNRGPGGPGRGGPGYGG